MKNSIFTLAPSERTPQEHTGPFPEIVTEAVQVFECSWDDTFPLKHDEELMEYHFLLHIDKISLKKKWHDCLFKGKGFPRLPIDYGYRDNSRFWFTKHSRPYRVPIPQEKGHTIEAVTYAVQRYDPDITWEEAACKKIIKVPNIFLTKVIAGAVKAAKAEGLTVITPEFLDKLQDKRSSGK
ncbi:MAG: hypothetical protein GY850_40210 [bacterium]|nr:hypothetical protein [bacterium]